MESRAEQGVDDDVGVPQPGSDAVGDGGVLDHAVLDESVLTGEAQSVQRELGQLLNAYRTTKADDS